MATVPRIESYASIASIEYALPTRIRTNADIAEEFPDWDIERISAKTGILNRHIAGPGEAVSDLAVDAARRVFAVEGIDRSRTDYLILCTQTPDYFLPTTACLVQERVGLPKSCGAVDINQGCSGYVYGLGLATALIQSGQARQVLLITADTYSRHLRAQDKAVHMIFGDGAAATLLVADRVPRIRHFVYGTDGSGAEKLIVRGGAGREMAGGGNIEPAADAGLTMDGPEIFAFSLDVVPKLINQVLAEAGIGLESVDFLVLHQANRFMLDALARRVDCPEHKLLRAYTDFGNTVSSTIPIALAEARNNGRLRPGMRILLVGFGVGLSWAGCLLDWNSNEEA